MKKERNHVVIGDQLRDKPIKKTPLTLYQTLKRPQTPPNTEKKTQLKKQSYRRLQKQFQHL